MVLHKKKKFKIVIATCQITSDAPSVLNVAFPSSVALFFSFLSVFNVNFASLLPVSCGSSGHKFFKKLLVATLVPGALSFIILVGYWCEYFNRKKFGITIYKAIGIFK